MEEDDEEEFCLLGLVDFPPDTEDDADDDPKVNWDKGMVLIRLLVEEVPEAEAWLELDPLRIRW